MVVFVNGSGPNTYDNTRQLDEQTVFNYFDLFTEQLTSRGTAFFRWSTARVLAAAKRRFIRKLTMPPTKLMCPKTALPT